MKNSEFSLCLYPWERNEKPYFVNNEGFEWYVDKINTDYARKDDYFWSGGKRKGLKNVGAFYVRKGEIFNSVLINDKQEVILDASSFVELWDGITKLKIWEDYATHDDHEELKERKNFINEISEFSNQKFEPYQILSQPENKDIY